MTHLTHLQRLSTEKTLCDLIRGYNSLSIIGMCKNAGKTTVLNAILRDTTIAEHTLALTSIGRDGEAMDLVTGTKKPGIYVRKGSLIATAERLLRQCDITKEILFTTGISTPLGEVVVLRARSDGSVQLAGPSMVTQLVELSHQLRELGAEKVVIDGAASRKTLCSRRLAEATVLCTGASCGRSMDTVVEETAHVCRLLGTKEVDNPFLAEAVMLMENHRYLLFGQEPILLAAGTDLQEALKEHGDIRYLYVEGAVTNQLLDPLLRSGALTRGIKVVARDASRLFLSPDALRRLHVRKWELRVLECIHLAAIAVNPYSAYGYNFDSTEFLRTMTDAVTVPVVNVEDKGDDVL